MPKAAHRRGDSTYSLPAASALARTALSEALFANAIRRPAHAFAGKRCGLGLQKQMLRASRFGICLRVPAMKWVDDLQGNKKLLFCRRSLSQCMAVGSVVPHNGVSLFCTALREEYNMPFKPGFMTGPVHKCRFFSRLRPALGQSCPRFRQPLRLPRAGR